MLETEYRYILRLLIEKNEFPLHCELVRVSAQGDKTLSYTLYYILNRIDVISHTRNGRNSFCNLSININ